jgi:putative tryptophan/tyrosine transport system substrate-binding protein
MTGATYFVSELAPKRLELLRELVPRAGTIAYLLNPTSSANDPGSLQAAARSVGQPLVILQASTAAEIDAAFASMAQQRVGALEVGGDAFFGTRIDQIVALAAHFRIPASYYSRAYTAAGGLMSYDVDRSDSERPAGIYVGRILKGEKPGDLPVLQPTKLQLAINLKTAKALGLTVSREMLLIADEVIE